MPRSQAQTGRLVFVSDRDAPGPGGREIYTSGADGSDPRRLTTNIVADTEPAFSPNGTRIAFTRSNDIWVMNADGSGQVAVTGLEGPDSAPAWSPDGTQIVYVSNQSVPADGHSEQRRQRHARLVSGRRSDRLPEQCRRRL